MMDICYVTLMARLPMLEMPRSFCVSGDFLQPNLSACIPALPLRDRRLTPSPVYALQTQGPLPRNPCTRNARFLRHGATTSH